jgi:hypothetical protein
MKVIIQNLDDEPTIGIGETLQFSGIETMLWNTETKSIFDMFYEQKPDLVIAHNVFVKSHIDEIQKANKNNVKIYSIGMEIDEGNFVGRCLKPFCNIINCINPKTRDIRYTCDVALIANYIRPTDIQYLVSLIEMIENLNIGTFRIYGQKLETPYYVGQITRSQNRLVYKNTSILIDLYGEHYLNPFLYDNFAICELANPEFDQFDNTHSLEDTMAKIAEKIDISKTEQYKSSYCIQSAQDFNNFKAVAEILKLTGFESEIEKVKQKEKDTLDEYWYNRK